MDQRSRLDADTNLAVLILPNSSVVGIARTAGPPTGILTHLVTASHWKDPHSYIGRWDTRLFPGGEVDYAGLEDPFLYLDSGGIYHAVFHNQIEDDDQRLCGGHAFSKNGFDWNFTGTAWSNHVHYVDGTTYDFSRRERPHFVFGDPKDPFKITALTTGVQYGTKAPMSVDGQDACYTLLQPTRQ